MKSDIVNTLKSVKLQEIEDVTIYALLKSMDVDITKTKSFYFYSKFQKRRKKVFLYYLSKELKVSNNLGLRRYVDEYLKN